MQRVEFADAGVAPWGKMETAIPKEWTPTALQSTVFMWAHARTPRAGTRVAHTLLIGHGDIERYITVYGFTTPTF